MCLGPSILHLPNEGGIEGQLPVLTRESSPEIILPKEEGAAYFTDRKIKFKKYSGTFLRSQRQQTSRAPGA